MILTIGTPAALAAKTHLYTGTSFGPDGAGGTEVFQRVDSVAVDAASEDVFVLDSPAGRIYKFSSAGAPADFSSTGTNFISSGAVGAVLHQIAIAPVGSPGGTAGDIYVTNGTQAVQVFASSGALLGELEQPAELTCGVATDSAGNVYVGSYRSTIHKYTPSTNPPTASDEVGMNTEPIEGVCNVAADGNRIYAADPNGHGLYELDGLADPTATRIDPTAVTMGLDPTTHDLYADRGEEIVQYDDAGTMLGSFGLGSIAESRSVASNAGATKLYVADGQSVKVFGPAVIVPDATTEAATALTGSAATLNGTVGAAAGPPATCVFQYTPAATFKTQGYTGALETACSPAGPFTGSPHFAVGAGLTGLSAGTEYDFRLVAKNETGSNRGTDETFTTPGPTVDEAAVSGVTSTGALLKAEISPNGEETGYAFEYVSEAEFMAGGYAGATQVPLGGQSIGEGISRVEVSQQIGGLDPRTTYHVRVIATSTGGTSVGPDLVFTTYAVAASGLPDGRAYEQVSPVEKLGQRAQGYPGVVQAGVDGNSFAYSAEDGFPGAEGAQEYGSFVAHRGPSESGWSTQGLLPPAATGTEAFPLGWSEDLSRSYSEARPPEGTFTLYERETATPSVRPLANVRYEGQFVAAPGAGQKLAFETREELVQGAAEGWNVYLRDSGTGQVTLASVLNSGQAPIGGAIAGQIQGEHRNYRNFPAAEANTLSPDATNLFFTSVANGSLYLRHNLDRPQNCADQAGACTFEVSKSRRTDPDPNGPHPAFFQYAATDGSVAFFTSAEALTNEATTGPTDEGSDLYGYEFGSDRLSDLVPDPGDVKGAQVKEVIGGAADGSSLYFTANGILAGNEGVDGTHAASGACEELLSPCNLYRWSTAGGVGSGSISYIARLPVTSVNQNEEAEARVSENGNILLFGSPLRVTSYDNKGEVEFYRYVAGAGEATCISCDPTGIAPSGNARLQTVVTHGSIVPTYYFRTRNMSPGGNRIFFETPEALLSTDVNGANGCPTTGGEISCLDVYEWETSGTGSCHSDKENGGCLFLISAGTSPEPSYFGDASRSGDDVFIFTRQPLVDQDRDSLVDVYDARVGGGIAGQNPPISVKCGGAEACSGPATSATPALTPGTSIFSGPGNEKPPIKKHKKHQKPKKRYKRHKHSKQAHKHHHAGARNGNGGRHR